MSDYRDIHNNVYKVIQRTLTPETDEEREMVKDGILNDLFNIFDPAHAKTTRDSNDS